MKNAVPPSICTQLVKLSPKGATHCRFRSLHSAPPRVLPEEGTDPIPLTDASIAVPTGEYVIDFYQSGQILPATDPPPVIKVPLADPPSNPARGRQLAMFAGDQEPDTEPEDEEDEEDKEDEGPTRAISSELQESRGTQGTPGNPAAPEPRVPSRAPVSVPPPTNQDAPEGKHDPLPAQPRTGSGGDAAKPKSEEGRSAPRPVLEESAQLLAHLHTSFSQHLEQFGEVKAQIREAEMLLGEREKFLFMRNHEREKLLFDTNLEREKLLFEANLEREKLLLERDKQRLATAIEAEKTIRDASRAIWKEGLDATKDRKEAQPKPRADMTLIANTLGVAVVQSVAEIWKASVGSGKKKKKKKERDPAETPEKSQTPAAVVKAQSTEDPDKRASLLLDELLKFANPLELQQVLNDEDAAQRFKDRIDAIRQGKTLPKPDGEAE